MIMMRLLLFFLLLTVGHGELLKKFRMMDRSAGGGGEQTEDDRKQSSSTKQESSTAATTASSSSDSADKTVAMTCDAMLAKSLVTANEEKAAIVAERDVLLADLQGMTKTAEGLTRELEETTADLTQRLFDSKQELNDVQQSMRKQLQELDATYKAQLQEEQDNMALLRDRSERAIYETQQHAQQNLNKERQQHKEALQAQEETLVATQRHYETLAAAVRAEAAQNVTGLQTRANAMTKALTEKHEEHVELLQQEMKLAKAQQEERLRQVQGEAEERLEQLQDSSEKAMTELTADFTAKLEASKEEIAMLSATIETLETKSERLTLQYEQASEELTRWEVLYGSRSYCNFTYIQEDAKAAALATQQAVTAHVVHVAQEGAKTTRQLLVKTRKRAEPKLQQVTAQVQLHVQLQLNRAKGYYDEHLKAFVDKHFLPVYNEHILPFLNKAGAFLRTARKNCKLVAKLIHINLVYRFQMSCPDTLQKLEEMERVPAFIVSHAKQSCQDPKKTVNTFLWTLLALFVLIFRSVLWRTCTWLLLLPIRIAWFLSPLRLLFGRKPKAMGETKEEPSDMEEDEEEENADGTHEEEDDEDEQEEESPLASPVKKEPGKTTPPQ